MNTAGIPDQNYRFSTISVIPMQKLSSIVLVIYLMLALKSAQEQPA